jgi:NADP-dependent 3-hydroxy acid dehydrogenase YdfG
MTEQTGRLAGKVAIITGSARGQGEAEARLFVAEGARVVITDLLADEGKVVAADLGGSARFFRQDVASEESWADLMAFTVGEFGRLDVLVNNAAIHHLRTIEDETAEGFDRVVAVNLRGTFLGMRSALAPMRASGGGSIVNISSLAGLQGFYAHGAYAAAKWGSPGSPRPRRSSSAPRASGSTPCTLVRSTPTCSRAGTASSGSAMRRSAGSADPTRSPSWSCSSPPTRPRS